MPIYIFEHPHTGEQLEIVQSANENHRYEQNGVEWRRVFTSPHLAVDSSVGINVFSKEDFMRYTSNKKGTIGDLWDTSKEWSEARKEKAGVDTVQQEKFNGHFKRTGKKHPEQRRQDSEKRLKKMGVSLVD